jgi:protein SCO1/2
MVFKKWLLTIWIIVILLVITVQVATYFGVLKNPDDIVQAPDDIEDNLFWKAKDLTDFKLIGADNITLELNDLKGKWSFIFFGYLYCPDVCPLSLGKMGMTFKLLEKDPTISSEIQGIFVSVDPKRDTPELIKEYVSYFNPKFSGYTGSTAQVDAFTRQLGALYTLHTEESEENYLVTHNSTIFLVDPQGRLYGRFPQPHNSNEIAELFIKIRTFYNKQDEKRWALF